MALPCHPLRQLARPRLRSRCLSRVDPKAVAPELLAAFSRGGASLVPLSQRDPSFDLRAAYAVEAEVVRLRQTGGHTTVGRKVGYANRAVWRLLKLETLVWANMYDDTVQFADEDQMVSRSIGYLPPSKIEPEIVFKVKKSIPSSGTVDALGALESVKWLALGFEIIACPFPDWKYQPSDFVAACGLHAALVVGAPLRVEPQMIPVLVDQLSRFKVSLFKDEQLVEVGSGRNSLRNPALCLAELSSAISRQSGAELLAPGELVSSGTLTESHLIAPNQTWIAVIDGLDLPKLTLRATP